MSIPIGGNLNPIPTGTPTFTLNTGLHVGNVDFSALIPRVPGELITSKDWNALVAACKNVQDTLNALSQAAGQRLIAVESGLQQTQADLQKAVDRVATLEGVVHEYNRVTVKPSRAIYALGEIAEISATVTDIAGKPIVFTQQNRPWVTFVCTWGRLRAVPGFESDEGVGDRTVTVRTNLQGVAKARLQSDHAGAFGLDVEDQVSKSMNVVIPTSGKIVADLIRTSTTPVEAHVAGAFKPLSVEYDRTDAVHMRDYVDTYYQKYPNRVTGQGVLNIPQTWQDYRSTIMCFVQNSNDASAPDFGRSSGAMQVVFRDWISPWYHLEYSLDTTVLAQTYHDSLAPKFTADLVSSVNNIKEQVNSIVAGKGLLGKQRAYGVINTVLGQIVTQQSPTLVNAVTKSVQNAIAIQQTLPTLPGGQDVAFEVFTSAATHANTSVASVNAAVADVQRQLVAVQAKVDDATSHVSNLTNNLTAVDTRLTSALADTGAVGSLRVQLTTVKNQVGAFSALNPSEIATQLGNVANLNQRVLSLETPKK
jgi:hypothetical protein